MKPPEDEKQSEDDIEEWEDGEENEGEEDEVDEEEAKNSAGENQDDDEEEDEEEEKQPHQQPAKIISKIIRGRQIMKYYYLKTVESFDELDKYRFKVGSANFATPNFAHLEGFLL
jgi:hypothetical protein